jgi:hypothetical protein
MGGWSDFILLTPFVYGMTHTCIFEVFEAEPRYANNKILYLDKTTNQLIDVGTEPVDAHHFKSRDLRVLNREFKKQVAHNYSMFVHYKKHCQQLTTNLYDSVAKTKKHREKMKCDKFKVAISSYEDTFNRDFNAFYQERRRGDVPVYVCMLLDDSYEYLGHIYCWHTNDVCCGFGIRASVQHFFNKVNIRISIYLLEGVRLYALHNKCAHLFIPDPLFNMKRILNEHLFRDTRLYEHRVRNKFMGYSSSTSIRDLERGHNNPSVNGCLYSDIKQSFLTPDAHTHYGFSIIERDRDAETVKGGGGRRTRSNKRSHKRCRRCRCHCNRTRHRARQR